MILNSINNIISISIPIWFQKKGTKFNPDEGESNEMAENKIIYEQAEQQYTKLSRQYIISWSGIVCLYGFILTIIPGTDMCHGKMDATNWPNLFKAVYAPYFSNVFSLFFYIIKNDFKILSTGIHLRHEKCLHFSFIMYLILHQYMYMF